MEVLFFVCVASLLWIAVLLLDRCPKVPKRWYCSQVLVIIWCLQCDGVWRTPRHHSEVPFMIAQKEPYRSFPRVWPTDRAVF